ncbi:geranylgeranylglyceryl phosphate synthase [Salegentibacter salinarum]|uniref:Geranylgeranylglyceryl phosphate synthase n=1 Tax=Salegentibacter salinarum TaxID=447422 RepID=A0A2N0U4H9_9FLAO|nr:geranylgeranylglyceryl/heptaprenylglyceryl phosphate synthase [Salegentibacter salinarum]PKD21894.1 geranylgeranylglyceryl phosphate synthase [Salegentibacter salinarum]SKB32317.1 putative glycerol-1-phosphate prenyltransferase [Salegentibacter salinarum]
MRKFYTEISLAATNGKKQLAILVDPDKFIEAETGFYLKKLPKETTHIFVGGSTVDKSKTEKTVHAIKVETDLPVILFPGDYSQITEIADALLFLSLISGRNPEYLIEQQVKSVEKLKNSKLEIIPTAYILIDGGKECAVQRVSGTKPIPQSQVETIVNTALAGEFSGKKLIYLEAGSGADFPVSEEIIAEAKKALTIPLIVGGGIRSLEQQNKAYKAGADMIVMGTHFETN